MCCHPAWCAASGFGQKATRGWSSCCQNGSIKGSDNETVRLIHRKRLREDSLEEGECYDHSYREHVSDHVEVVRLEPVGIRLEVAVEFEAEHHVTTERLKGQFEERLAARTRRSRRTRP
jgi:hypothetical protein